MKALSSPGLREIWANIGAAFTVMKPAEFAPFVNREIKRWADMTRVSGAKLD